MDSRPALVSLNIEMNEIFTARRRLTNVQPPGLAAGVRRENVYQSKSAGVLE
jgi:hypothetical protein